MTYTLSELAEMMNATLTHKAKSSRKVDFLIIDSRQVFSPARSVFFALKGAVRDGHQFIPEVYHKGIRAFVVSEDFDTTKYPDADFVVVPDTQIALQQLAAAHRAKFHIPVIGITGSNGKTIVKEWLSHILSREYEVVKSPKSYNSQVGVPISLWQMEAKHQIGIFEAGISRMGEMNLLSDMIHCNIGILTKMGSAHNEGFDSIETKISEKLKLFKYADAVIYCSDKPPVRETVEQLIHVKKIAWSRLDETADLFVTGIVKDKNHSVIHAIYRGETMQIRIPFINETAIQNALYCWTTLLYLNINPQTIASGMETLEPLAMRLEIREGVNQSTIVNDSYNSDLTSLQHALNFLEQNTSQKYKAVILSDILQSGKDPDALYQKVGQYISEKKISKVIGIGKDIRVLHKYLMDSTQSQFFDTTEDYLRQLQIQNIHNEAVLIKGARIFGFERIAEAIAQRQHRTTLEIDINALAHNLDYFRTTLRPKTKIMVMVKASAYGSGSAEVARFLQHQKVDFLAVAYADEGVELRQNGIQVPIMVMNPEGSAFQSILDYSLQPELYSLNILKSFAAYTESLQGIFPVHIKVDTGMHRLGFLRDDIDQLVEVLKSNPNLKVGSVFSHLSSSDDEREDSFTRIQIEEFEKFYTRFTQAIGYKPIRHVLNSSGVLRFVDYQYEMVRLGIGLYGITNESDVKKKLMPVHTLKAVVSQIKYLKEGDSVGYNRRHKAANPEKIATISIGYADGLHRMCGNGRASVIINGVLAPVIGSVCMDMCMIDVTHVENIKEGDQVVLFGKELDIEHIARSAETIPYEIITGISHRVRRVFFKDEI